MAGLGADVEALSPRDANARRPRVPVTHDPKTDLKSKAAAQLKANKDKDHPPPPPLNVTEPPSADRRDGALYQVGKLLGKGGFAVCYMGQLAGSKRVFALKIVKSKMPPKMEQKFQTELQIHSKMRHPNIVQFFRAFSFEKSTYLVLELCPNGSLMDMVKRRKGVTEPEVRYYAVQIAGAIKYMHAKGIIHRDLKMGNIFLDRHMNAKIGDFGLAALVVTGRDMQTIRRTTLCGTPNYIAPEILEKGRKGHDHMVDIWSLGIIMFAMLTSKPPFQSTTTDEIYRRARERDYEWPEPPQDAAGSASLSRPPISQDARHIVSSLLQEAHMRPDPDTIVEHPFFTSGYMPTPDDITVRLRQLPPDNDMFYRQPSPPRVQARNRETLQKMCQECGVGSLAEAKSASKAVWREMAAEEKAGLTPVIPLADHIVYRPFETWLQENQLLQAPSATAAATAAAAAGVGAMTINHVDAGPSLAAPSSSSSSLPPATLSSRTASRQPTLAEWMPAPALHAATSAAAPSGLRAPPQSFAAQQRQQSTRASARREVVSVPLGNGLSLQAREQQQAAAAAAAKMTVPSLPPPSSTATRTSQRTALPGSRVVSRTGTLSRTARKPTPPAIFTGTDDNDADATAVEHPQPPMPPKLPRLSLFSPAEVPESVPSSEPEAVLQRLRKLQAELDRALNTRTMAFMTARERMAASSSTAPPATPQIVVKWVDYSNRYGLGYILNDGSVGCILRAIHVPGSNAADAELPPSCLMVRGAEHHIQRRDDLSYVDRHQILPMGRRVVRGPPGSVGAEEVGEGEGVVRFFENNGEEGFQRVCVEAASFRVPVDPRTGAAGKLSSSRDVFDHRKRERIVLWKKFANYMLAYGRELDSNEDARRTMGTSKMSAAAAAAISAAAVTADVSPAAVPPAAADASIVTFFQRFGDVGCWVFGDGHLQFNFPDHTKIVLDAAGTACHFWHLPISAAQRLANTGLVDEDALDGRSVLSYPLQTLLNFATADATSASSTASSSSTRRRPYIRPEMQGIPAANDFRRKVEFVRAVVREWVSRGGLGCSDMSRAGRLRWTGARETVKYVPGTSAPTPLPASKHVWVTIGARKGDLRVSAMVDPSRPAELGPDLEDQRR